VNREIKRVSRRKSTILVEVELRKNRIKGFRVEEHKGQTKRRRTQL